MRNPYNECSINLSKILTGVKYVAIISNTWTSISTESYLSVTSNFILDSTLKSAILISQNIADVLKEIFDEGYFQ